MTITARSLQTRDIWAWVRILKSTKADIRAAVRDARIGSNGTFNADQLGLDFFLSLLDQADTGVRDWLADMVGLKPEELDELPPSQTMDLIDTIRHDPEFPAFLERVSTMLGWKTTNVTSSAPATVGPMTRSRPSASPATGR